MPNYVANQVAVKIPINGQFSFWGQWKYSDGSPVDMTSAAFQIKGTPDNFVPQGTGSTLTETLPWDAHAEDALGNWVLTFYDTQLTIWPHVSNQQNGTYSIWVSFDSVHWNLMQFGRFEMQNRDAWT